MKNKQQPKCFDCKIYINGFFYAERKFKYGEQGVDSKEKAKSYLRDALHEAGEDAEIMVFEAY